MAPFPEEENMTIKRLEVALRKSDFKLLKEGAYKLHEKYHQHHRFQYLDSLENILNEVQQNYAIPSDIKDILIPTIQDILSNSKEESQNRVSSLTSLSYGVNSTAATSEQQENAEIQNFTVKEDTIQKEEYIKPFQEFTPIKPIETVFNNVEQKTDTSEETEDKEAKLIVESYNQTPNEDFDTGAPLMPQQNIFEKIEPIGLDENSVSKEQEEDIKEEQVEFLQNNKEIPEQTSSAEVKPLYFTEETDDIEFNDIKEQKTITLFFDQPFSGEKNKNITKYQDLIKNRNDFSLRELISLINEIKLQADTNVSELQTIIEQLKSTNHKINIITNSQSANFIDLFNQSDVAYSIFESNSDKRINLLPIFGLTNLYKCIECNNEYLETNEKINSFILQCPKCKSAMFPDLYSPKGKINLDYYNSAIVEFANSNIWLLLHPSITEKFSIDMIKSTAKVSSKLKEVYILDKDINSRETYKKIFEDINPEIKVVSDISAIEDFLNNI